MTSEIKVFRGTRSRVAVAYSTKDRAELSARTVGPLLETPDIDLYWFDGSSGAEGRRFAAAVCGCSPAVCELHTGVIGGPDSAIMYMLETLRSRGYDLVVLIENDVLVSEGWLGAMLASMRAAERDGFRVGASSVRVYAQRVLSFNGDHCLLLNSGAGFIGLTPAAVDIILANYRTVDGIEFVQSFRHLTGIDVSSMLEFEPNRLLSCDWFFDLLLYMHGYVVSAPPISLVRMLDSEEQSLPSGAVPVFSVDDHLADVRGRIRSPDRIRVPAFAFVRFQIWRPSGRFLIGCHQLLVGMDADDHAPMVRLEGTWNRRWSQGCGPFVMLGAGRITISTFGPRIGVLVVPSGSPVRCVLSSASGYRMEGVLQADQASEILLDETEGPDGRLTLEITEGLVNLIGITAGLDALSGYANARPSVAHLPL